jgi:16S rRNA (uracil1498-N3)-methyltransferase
MQLFYTNDLSGTQAILNEEESKHCTQVLRKKVGDSIHLFDGIGTVADCTIISITKKECIVSIDFTRSEKANFPHIHIAIAPTKNIDRFEWFLEKATEIGVNEITPLLCKRMERDKINMARLQTIIMTAAKQSMQLHVPILNPLIKMGAFLKQNDENAAQKLIAYCDYENNTPFRDNYLSGNNVKILVGPEGDFTNEEVQLSFANGYKATALGPKRLRTETAGIVAVHCVRLLNEK